jgi:hypothetical protein
LQVVFVPDDLHPLAAHSQILSSFEGVGPLLETISRVLKHFRQEN